MNKKILQSPEITNATFIRQVKTLLMFGLLNKDLVKPILAQLETLNEKHKFNLSELITLQTYLGRFKQIKEVRSDGLVKIGMWTN